MIDTPASRHPIRVGIGAAIVGGFVFSLHQPHKHPGAAAVREVSAIRRLDWATGDITLAEAFDADEFGWRPHDQPNAPTEYRMFFNDDNEG